MPDGRGVVLDSDSNVIIDSASGGKAVAVPLPDRKRGPPVVEPSILKQLGLLIVVAIFADARGRHRRGIGTPSVCVATRHSRPYDPAGCVCGYGGMT